MASLILVGNGKMTEVSFVLLNCGPFAHCRADPPTDLLPISQPSGRVSISPQMSPSVWPPADPALSDIRGEACPPRAFLARSPLRAELLSGAPQVASSSTLGNCAGHNLLRRAIEMNRVQLRCSEVKFPRNSMRALVCLWRTYSYAFFLLPGHVDVAQASCAVL